MGKSGFRQVAIVLSVRRAHRMLFAARGQLFQRVLADRLQHQVARRTIRALRGPEQAAPHERGHALQDVAAARNRPRRIEREAADEDPQPPKEHLVPLLQQVMAPGDRIAQTSQPFGYIAGTVGQHGQTVLKPDRQCCGRKDAYPGGSQLDRQRQSIQPAQIASTTGVVSSVRANAGSAARARTTNRLRAESRSNAPMGNTCSPETPRRVRLVHRMVRPGA
jgi:hypothetical protein